MGDMGSSWDPWHGGSGYMGDTGGSGHMGDEGSLCPGGSEWSPCDWNGGWRMQSGYFRERRGHAEGPRWGWRGGSDNAKWHTMRAKAQREGWLDIFIANYPKPDRKRPQEPPF